MSTTSSPAFQRMELAAHRRAHSRVSQAARQYLRSKRLLALALGLLFWFSVPYSLPKHLPNVGTATLAADNAEQFDGSISRQIAVPLIALCAWFMLKRYPKRGVVGGRLFILVCMYVGWVLASVAWSEDPQVSAKRLIVFLLDCFFVYALSRTITEMEMALAAAITTFATGILSVLSDIFLLHTFNPADADYRLMGVMTPNHQGMNLVACALCLVALMLRRPRWAPWLSVALVTTLAMLWITRARIGTILCLLLVGVALNKFLRDRFREQARLGVVLLMLLLIAPMLVFVFGNNAGGAAQSAFMMGRKDTENTSNLSNRLPLWQELMGDVEEHPVLGFGYGAFWTAERAARISLDQGWPVPHAHNTYLDQTIALGVVGGSLYLVMMVSALVVAWGRYLRVRSSSNLLNAMLLTWLVLLNTSESAPLDPHLPSVLVYAAVLRMCLREGSVDNADPVPDRPIVEGLTFEKALPPASPATPVTDLPPWRTPVVRRPA